MLSIMITHPHAHIALNPDPNPSSLLGITRPSSTLTPACFRSVFSNWAQFHLAMQYLSEMTNEQTLTMCSGSVRGMGKGSVGGLINIGLEVRPRIRAPTRICRLSFRSGFPPLPAPSSIQTSTRMYRSSSRSLPVAC